MDGSESEEQNNLVEEFEEEVLDEDDYEEEFEYVEVERSKEEIKNKKKLYLENDYPDERKYQLAEDNSINEANNIELQQKKNSRSKLASKRPIQRAPEPLDIEPLEDNNLVTENQKSDKLEIEDPW